MSPPEEPRLLVNQVVEWDTAPGHVEVGRVTRVEGDRVTVVYGPDLNRVEGPAYLFRVMDLKSPRWDLDSALREIARIKACVRSHYDQRGDDRCHFDDLKLYHDVLGIETDPYVTALPPDLDMHESCRRYIAQRQDPEVHGKFPMPEGMTIAQLTERVRQLQGRPRVCVGIDVTNPRDDQILLLRRSPGRSWGGYWCLPGGHIEAGESVRSACRRELEEEIGVSVSSFLFRRWTEEWEDDRHMIGLVFSAVGIDWLKVRNLEPGKHDQMAWFSRDNLPGPMMKSLESYLLDED